jgi:hypothetical protein
MRRIVVLLALVMAVVILSAPAATAKKKHHHRRPSSPSINVVVCPNQPDGFSCIGTGSGDYLIGRDGIAGATDSIYGKEGNDVYDGKGGCDYWNDESTTSDDYYLISVKDFGCSGFSTGISDVGGSQDILDLSRFYKSSDFTFSRRGPTPGGNLVMDGPGDNDIQILAFCAGNSVDSFKFSDKTLTAAEVRSMASC